MQQRMHHGTQRFLRQLGVAIGFWAAMTAQAAPPGLAKLPAAAQEAPGLAVAQSSVAPSVALSTPADGTVVVAPALLTVSATASDAHGSIVRVDFYQGTTLLSSATTAPYQLTWGPVPAGRYTLTAVATNDRRQSATSAPVGVLVNAPPTVSLVSPGALHLAPATLALTANASDADGSISRVEFLANGIPIGTATSVPYAIDWRNVAAGTYSLTARATDDHGATTDSPPVSVTVNSAPSVALTSPAADQVAVAPAQITLTASASDADGSVANVEFYAGTTLVGTATAAPYSAGWSSVAAGAYSLTARATDNLGAVTTSAPVAILVDAPPSVALTSPAEASTVVAPSLVTLVASASDADGTVSKVDFYADSSLVGTATTAPYSASWNATVPGHYSLTAVATDDRGVVTTSAARSISVAANQLPSISLTSPAAGQGFTAPATVTLTASASDVDGTIAQVAFYGNDTLLGTVTTAPYSLTWANLEAGSYTVTAQATDDHGGVMSSAPLTLIVGAASTRIVYLYADQLGTPRLATDSNGTVIWRHDPLTEPFGNAPPEEDPDGDGVPFTLNLRFPGQVFDMETNLAYNYFRDYDPATGRYIQSDPIGLAGGSMSLYTYVENDPLGYSDPLGLARKPAPGTERLPSRSCNATEAAQCRAQCGSRGVDMCYVRRSMQIIGATGEGKKRFGVKEEVICSCNEECPDESLLKKLFKGLTGAGSSSTSGTGSDALDDALGNSKPQDPLRPAFGTPGFFGGGFVVP